MSPPLWAYQVENFEPPPDEELVCSVCRGVFCDPVQSPCNHVFCRNCINKWLESNRNCPICRKRTTRYTVQEVVPLIRNMIMKLTLRCHNVERGCEEKFTLEGCESHVKECTYEMIQCKNKPCEQILLRRDIRDHELNNCPHRYIRCKKCCLKVSTVETRKHNCVRALKQSLKGKVEIIKKKNKKIKELQDEIKTLKENERGNSDLSSVESLSDADIMINLTLPDMSSNSSVETNSYISSDTDDDDDGSFWMSTSDILEGLERRFSQQSDSSPDGYLVEDESLEYPRTSSPVAEDSFSTSVNPLESTFDDEPQIRRPAKRRHPPQLLDSSDDDNDAELELPSLPSPKRSWLLFSRDNPETYTQLSSNESPSQAESSLEAAGPSGLPSSSTTVADAATSDIPVSRGITSFKLRPKLKKRSTEEQTVSTTSTAVRNGNATFERTIALLEQYNLESDPEWFPTDSQFQDTNSEFNVNNHPLPFLDGHITSSDESSLSDIDSSDTSYEDVPSTAKLDSMLNRMYSSNSDDDPDWHPS